MGSTAFRLKTFPEILANKFATARALIDEDIDLSVGSVFRTIFEATSLQDADQYIQISKLLDLFSIDRAQGEDLDRRAEDFGAKYFPIMRRRQANTSVSQISVGDGTFIAIGALLNDVSIGDTVFNVQAGQGASFPSSGSLVLDKGTSREEEIIFTVAGDTFTVVFPSTGVLNGHAALGSVTRLSTKSYTTAALAVGATTATLLTGTGAAWPTSGKVIFDRGLAAAENVLFTRSGDTLTLTTGTVFAHSSGATATLSTAGSNRTIATGAQCFSPATDTSAQVNFTTTTAGVLLDGDITSGLIAVESAAVGSDTRVGSNTITQWVSPPFSGATITNPIAATRGADQESDVNYRQRLKDYIQSLSRGTALAIETLVTGVTEPTTNQQVSFAQVIEPVNPGASLLYITDGTPTFGLTQTQLIGRDVIIRDADAGDQRGRLAQLAPYEVNTSPPTNITPRIFKSATRGVATSVGSNYLEDTAQIMTTNQYVGCMLKTDDDQFYLITGNTTIRFVLDAGATSPSLGSYSVFNFQVAPLVPNTDYNFNESTGDLEMATPLLAHDSVVAASDNAIAGLGAYTYSTGLGAYVQRLVNGDPTDFVDFPGIKSTGTKVLVLAPVVQSPAFIIQVVTGQGFADADLKPLVVGAVQTYVNSLGIGDNIILSAIIALVKNLPGVNDVTVVQPSANIPIPAGQIARIDASYVTVV